MWKPSPYASWSGTVTAAAVSTRLTESVGFKTTGLEFTAYPSDRTGK